MCNLPQEPIVCKKAHEDMNDGLQQLARTVFPNAPWHLEVVLAGQAGNIGKTLFRETLATVLGSRQIGAFKPTRSVPGLVVIHDKSALNLEPIALTFTTPAHEDYTGVPCDRVLGRNTLAQFIVEAFV
jgi:hypothetical protein